MPGFGDLNSPCSAGNGDVPFPTLFILSFGGRSGLVEVDAGVLAVRCDGGRGEMGTFSRKHSSGTSSPSSSSHSNSNSFADFLSLFDCQLPLLTLGDAVGKWCLGLNGGICGLMLRFRFMIGSDGVLGLRRPFLGKDEVCGAGINPSPSKAALLTCPRRLGYGGRGFDPVNSL